jgi:hypothetical protein
MAETKAPPGLRRLIRRYVREFRIPENLYYYSDTDFQKAERRFVKHCLSNGRFSESGEDSRTNM